ncbi:MAG: response regulator [Chloroflexi bacterium]|nr:response regulator [Chloroflexota bacterium]
MRTTSSAKPQTQALHLCLENIRTILCIFNELVVALDGVEGLDYLFGAGAHSARDTSKLPVVVLLDLKMPRLDGLEVLKRVRANPVTKLLPVVVLTSSKVERDVVSSYEFGCNSYVRKPVDFNQFAEAIHQLGLYWLVLNEPVPP